MREMSRHPYQNTPRDAVVTAVDYADGTLFPLHDHQRGQFAYAASGVITVFTDDGNWVVPPQRGIWVPARLRHAMQMRGPVTLHNTYIRQQAAQRLGLSEQCQVLDVSPLLRHLLMKAIDVPARYSTQGHDGHLMGLLLHEISSMPALSLNAPLPAEPRLATVCRAFLEQPSLEIGIDEMAQRAGMSRRTFTRHFRLHTGVSYIEWRQQACLLAAIVMLGKGQSVTQVAMDLGYSSSSAFATVFKQVLGEVPSRYF
jgi:AraC-like DNA-binding protein